LSISNFHVVGVVRVRDKCEKKIHEKRLPQSLYVLKRLEDTMQACSPHD
jgi:hypothetical protein